MRPLPLALPSGSSIGRHPHAGVATIINGYAEATGGEQKSPMQIWAAPGLDPLVTVATTGGVRGLIEVDGVAYAVIGRSLYQVGSGGSATLIGGIPSDGHVGMARNQRATGVQIAIVANGPAWSLVGGTLTKVTDPDLPSVIDVCVVNRSAIYLEPNGSMYRSEIDDVTSIDGLDTSKAESAPDQSYRVVDRGADLIVLGQRSTEVWLDIGAEAFGFTRQATIRNGAVSQLAVTKASLTNSGGLTDTVSFVATSDEGAIIGPAVMVGATISEIGDDYARRKVASESSPQSIVATSWVEQGTGFIAFRLSDTTLVYNTRTQRWHERQSRDTYNNATTWRVSHCTVLGDKVLAGDHDNPKLYWLDPATYTDAGDEMVVTIRTPPAHAFPGRLDMTRLHLDVVPGVGLATGADADVNPVVTMRYSRDGETWSSGRDRAIGAIGKRGTRVDWTRVGTFDLATFEFSCSAAVARGFMGASWEGETLPP